MSDANPKGAFDRINVEAAVKEDSGDAARLIYMTGERLFKYLFFPDIKKPVSLGGLIGGSFDIMYRGRQED
jgi:hypothetical protein